MAFTTDKEKRKKHHTYNGTIIQLSHVSVVWLYMASFSILKEWFTPKSTFSENILILRPRADPLYTQNTQAAWRPRNTRVPPCSQRCFHLVSYLKLASGYENNYFNAVGCHPLYVKSQSNCVMSTWTWYNAKFLQICSAELILDGLTFFFYSNTNITKGELSACNTFWSAYITLKKAIWMHLSLWSARVIW